MNLKKYTKKDFENHLLKEHRQTPFSEYLKEFVYGGVDGIVTTFAVVAGFTGASQGGEVANYSILLVLLFGLANLFADGTSMALGNFLSIRSDKALYKKSKQKESYEIKNNPGSEKAETIFLLESKGFSHQEAVKLTEIYSKNDKYWLDFMMKHELNMEDPENQSAVLRGLATFVSFIFFGFLPILPYIVFSNFSLTDIFLISCLFTFLSLVLLGFTRALFTSEKWYKAVFEVVLVGSVSALVAYFVGTFFG